MNKVLELILQNQEIVISFSLFLVGWLLPTPNIFKLGKKVNSKLPAKINCELIIKLEAFVQGLKDSSVDGNYELTDNKTIDSKYKSLKSDLGL